MCVCAHASHVRREGEGGREGGSKVARGRGREEGERERENMSEAV